VQAEDFTRRELDLAGWPIVVETYRLDGVYFTSVSSADAGARFARAQGVSRGEAENAALEKAERWLNRTRKFGI
jgi:hypothetical protein